LAFALFARAARESEPRQFGVLGTWAGALRLRLAALAGSKTG